MGSLVQVARDNVLYQLGYAQGRFLALPQSLNELYAYSMSKLTGLLSLPLPLLSFLALPFYGGTSASLSVLFFYMTWSVLVFSYNPLDIEIYGTLATRLIFYLLPALLFLGVDCGVQDLSKNIKAFKEYSLPLRLGRDKLLKVTAISILNVLLSVAFQGALEILFTKVLHLRSILKVTTAVPLPLSIATDIARGFVLRGILHYLSHRYLLHTYNTPLKAWHAGWQHSVRLPFSLIATYDHPLCYLVGQWLPTFFPAYLFRFHVLTWHLFSALVGLEQLFIYSGYAVLPSSIVLAGMARRTDAHFATFKSDEQATNFGNWGILDFVCGTSCQETVDVVDDIQDEADKHHVKERANAAIDGARGGSKADKREKKGIEVRKDDEGDEQPDSDQGKSNEEDANDTNDNDNDDDPPESNEKPPEEQETSPVKRRSGRKRQPKT